MIKLGETVEYLLQLSRFSSGAVYAATGTPVGVIYKNGVADALTVTLTIVESADGIKGDTARNVQKPAKLETGLQVQVPLFIKEGDVIKVSTADGSYLGRA